MASRLSLSLIKTSSPRLHLSPFVDCLSSKKSGTLCRKERLMWFPSKPNSAIQPQLTRVDKWFRVLVHYCKTQLTFYKTGKQFLFFHFLLQHFWAVTWGSGCFPRQLGSESPSLEKQFPVLQTSGELADYNTHTHTTLNFHLVREFKEHTSDCALNTSVNHCQKAKGGMHVNWT